MDAAPHIGAASLRFDRVAITCVFGDPRDLRSWSGAPANLANALEKLGVVVEGIRPQVSKLAKLGIAALNMVTGHGRPLNGEHILLSLRSRRRLGEQVAEQARRLGTRHVLHTGTWDLPTRALASRHHLQADRYSARAMAAFEEAEHQSLCGLAHVFTFGAYVRDNLIAHYGLAPERVTAVGSGMGAIEPYDGPKSYDKPRLMFVAKHLFQATGGLLLLEAFELARKQRPDLALTIIGDGRSRNFVDGRPGITFHAYLPGAELQQLYRDSTLWFSRC